MAIQKASSLTKFNKCGVLSTLITALILGSINLATTYAATTPSLGAAATYGILANTYTNSTTGTTVNGDVGFLVGPTIEPAPIGGHTNYGSSSPYTTAGANQTTALSALNNEACTFTWTGAVDLFLDTQHGPAGTYSPGVYCTPGAFTQTGSITLNGSGTYIFRSTGAYTTTAGVSVLLAGGASACNVFWTPHATTFGAGTNFVGTLFDNDAVTSGAGTNILGRILALNGPVTTTSTTIDLPICTPPPATLRVIKQVTNNNGGTAVASSFTTHVKLAGTDVPGSPAAGADPPGTSYSLAAGTYTVSEDTDAKYSTSFSGDCDANGDLSIVPGDNKFCIITNDDIAAPVVVPPVPPLISIVTVPDPLSLPSGPGPVTYTFTLTNLGTVAVTNISVADDTCDPLVLISGDTNTNAQLEVNETWTYTCTTPLSQTHTNNVVATGQANGITATDIASATVVVDSAVVPPLIHVTNIPEPPALLAGGGAVTYTLKITNPGAVPLTSVSLTNDACAPAHLISGDSDSQLDTTETWTYACSANLTKTTVNTAMVSGMANNFTARDFAISMVTVGTVPGWPNTGE